MTNHYEAKDAKQLSCAFEHTFLLDSFYIAMINEEIENHSYLFLMKSHCGSVEFVATTEKYLGQEIASSMIRGIR